MIERGCNVNAVGGVLVSTPLHWAARHGHAHMIALLVTNGADVNIRDVEGITHQFLLFYQLLVSSHLEQLARNK